MPERRPTAEATAAERHWTPLAASTARMFGRRRGGRLLRHYFVMSVILIGGGLIVSGVCEIYFRYHEIRQHIALLQQEVASGAAFRIGQYIQEIHGSTKAATMGPAVASEELSPDLLDSNSIGCCSSRLGDHGGRGARQGWRRPCARPKRLRGGGGRRSPEGKKIFNSTAFQQAMSWSSYFRPDLFRPRVRTVHHYCCSYRAPGREGHRRLQAEVSLVYLSENVVSGITVGELPVMLSSPAGPAT